MQAREGGFGGAAQSLTRCACDSASSRSPGTAQPPGPGRQPRSAPRPRDTHGAPRSALFTRALTPQTAPPPPPGARRSRSPLRAAGRCSEQAFPGAGHPEMLGAGIARRTIGRDGRSGRSPGLDHGGMPGAGVSRCGVSGGHPRRGRGARADSATCSAPRAPSPTVPKGASPLPSAAAWGEGGGEPSRGDGNMGTMTVPARPAP